MRSADCPFCRACSGRELAGANAAAVAFRDQYPVSLGHTLIVPRQHVESVFSLSTEEAQSLWSLVTAVRQQLVQTVAPAGFNVGINDGAAAGQTVAHAHIHVIPRYVGDVPDPRGGVRWVVPARAAYWA